MDVFIDWLDRAFVLGQLRLYYWLPSVLLLSIPFILIVYYSYQKKRRWRVRYSIASAVREIPRVKQVKRYSRHLPLIFRLLVILLVILAAMRPQMGKTREKITTEGIDIILTLDISSSMLAQDFSPSRVEAAKEVLAEFVRQNQNDRIGLVVFSGMPFTQCPLTTDTAILEEFITQVYVGDVLQDGTAIGDAIVTSVARFPDQDVKSKIIILLTDGEHNLGEFDPQTGARIANRMGVRIYTIGVGGHEAAPIPDPNNPGSFVKDYFGRVVYTQLDEDTLRNVAQITGGRYYRAEDENALREIYEEIGLLETHEIESQRYTTYAELFQFVLAAALVMMAFEIISRQIWGRVLP
jgi:Ca-activated chloride channel family protein